MKKKNKSNLTKYLFPVAYAALSGLLILGYTPALFSQSYPIPTDTVVNGISKTGYKQYNIWIIAPKFSEGRRFSEGLALVKWNDYYAYINPKGNFVTDFRYVQALDYSEGVAPALIDGRWAYISTKGKKITDETYDVALPFNEGKAAVKRQGNWYFIDKSGRIIIKDTFDTVLQGFSDGMAVVGKNLQGKIKYGLIHTNGQTLQPFKFTASIQWRKYAVLKDSSTWKLYSATGKVSLTEDFDTAHVLNDSILLLGKDGYWGGVGPTLAWVLPMGFKQIFYSKKQCKAVPFKQWNTTGTSPLYFPAGQDSITKGNGYSIAHRSGRFYLYIPQKPNSPILKGDYFRQIAARSFMIASQSSGTGIYSILNQQWLIPPSYTDIQWINDKFLLKNQSGKYGLADTAGMFLLPMIHDTLFAVSNAFHARKGDSLTILTDLKITNLPFKSLTALNSAFHKARNMTGYMLLDTLYKLADSTLYTSILPYSDSMAACFTRDTLYVRSKAGLQIKFPSLSITAIPGKGIAMRTSQRYILLLPNKSSRLLQADSVGQFLHKNMVAVYSIGRLNVLNHLGNILLNTRTTWQEIHPFTQGYAKVKANNRYGFIDSSGLLLISTQYDSAHSFSEGHAAIKINKKWGFINAKEHLVAQPYYNAVSDFIKGTAFVRVGQLWGIIDRSGKEIAPLKFDHIARLPSGYFLVRKQQKYGLLNAQGREVLSVRYDGIKEQSNSTYVFRQFGKTGLTDARGTEVIPAKYEHLECNSDLETYLYYTLPPVITFTLAK